MRHQILAPPLNIAQTFLTRYLEGDGRSKGKVNKDVLARSINYFGYKWPLGYQEDLIKMSIAPPTPY